MSELTLNPLECALNEAQALRRQVDELLAENAKLRKELTKWHQLADGIDLPEYPVAQFKPKDLEREYSDENLTRVPIPCQPVYAGGPEVVGCQIDEVPYCELNCKGCKNYYEDHDMGATIPICRAGMTKREGCKMYTPTKEWR